MKTEKLVNYSLVLALLFALFVWSTVFNNASADISSGSAKISFLDVGQGDATLISLSGNNQVLIDTGKKGTLLKSLSQKMPVFDKKIEEVYLTHPDSDHIGAFEELSNNYQIEKVYFSWKNSDTENAKKVEEIIKLKTIPAETSYLGDVNYLGLLKLDTLWPKENLNLSSNDSSIVLKAEIEGSKALLTGDLEIKGQNLLLNTGQDLAADLIKIPHHGSAGAFDEGFMAKVGAKNAVISVGSNSYGHPSDVVLEGLKKFSISIFRTDELGTIDFISTSNRFIKR